MRDNSGSTFSMRITSVVLSDSHPSSVASVSPSCSGVKHMKAENTEISMPYDKKIAKYYTSEYIRPRNLARGRMVTSAVHEEEDEDDQGRRSCCPKHVTQVSPSYPASVTQLRELSHPEQTTEMSKLQHSARESNPGNSVEEGKLSYPDYVTQESNPSYSQHFIQGNKPNYPSYSEHFSQEDSSNDREMCDDYMNHHNKKACEIVCVQCSASNQSESYSASPERFCERRCPCLCHEIEVPSENAILSPEGAQSSPSGHEDNPSAVRLPGPWPSSRASAFTEHEPSSSCPASLNWAPEPPGNAGTGNNLTLREYLVELERIRRPQGNGGDVEKRSHRRNCIILIVFIICINVTIGLIRGLSGLPGVTDE
ncbi:uncharacterized protein LOC125027069 [Penaeus chinensis]|uniref:uncharacterized protein LOC125027069 n=1 Tax=Penaeus chinensis TaxID=139456 RepID=UPI001FB79675|nr:uncharacterized protein LOC125027069 [Penaeus chinensis]